MKGNPVIIQHLNKVLTNELTAVNQYFLHARMLKNWGFHKLAEHEYHESIEEMRHADWMIERILFLEGLPNLQDLHKLMIGETVREVLESDFKVEKKAHADLVAAVADAEALADYISRDEFKRILKETEGHIDWLETQLGLIDQVGEQNYLQSQM